MTFWVIPPPNTASDLHHGHTGCQILAVGILPEAVVLNQEWYWPPGDMGQFPHTFLVVPTVGWGLLLASSG